MSREREYFHLTNNGNRITSVALKQFFYSSTLSTNLSYCTFDTHVIFIVLYKSGCMPAYVICVSSVHISVSSVR